MNKLRTIPGSAEEQVSNFQLK